MNEETRFPPAGAPDARRRHLLLGTLALATSALGGCGGGGGGGDGGSTPAPPPAGGGGTGAGTPSGKLVYRNSGTVGVRNFGTNSEITFDPGTEPFVDPGVSVSPAGVIAVARQRSNAGFPFALYSITGQFQEVVNVNRAFAFQTSAVMFNHDSTRIAFSLDEEASATDNTRIAKTLVAAWPAATILAIFNGFQEPVWAGSTGELIVRQPGTEALYVINAQLGTPVALGRTVSSLTGGYNVAPDGNTIVHSDGAVVRAWNRSTGASWVAATHATSSTNSPVVSPDGRWLALLARANQVYVPHVVPFAANSTVTVTAAAHEVPSSLADCLGRIGWTV